MNCCQSGSERTTEQRYDDGTNRGDFTHSIVVMANEGTHEWGAVDLDDAEAWLLVGDNPTFTVDAAGSVTSWIGYTFYLEGVRY